MVTWFDYVLKKAVTYPALQETCVCTLHHGDTNFHDITVHYVGEYEGKAIVAISKLNPLFNTLSELFNPVVMIDLEALFPLDFGLIQTHWRPLLSCPENESVSFQRIDGTMFSGYRRNDNSIFDTYSGEELSRRNSVIFWQPSDAPTIRYDHSKEYLDNYKSKIIDVVTCKVIELLNALDKHPEMTTNQVWEELTQHIKVLKGYENEK